MKRILAILLGALLALPALAQSPGVGIDALPTAGTLAGTELMPAYQAGSGGSGALTCARGWCPVSITPAAIARYIASPNALVIPIINGGTGSTTLAGASIVTFGGSLVTGHCAQWSNGTGTLIDSGNACGGGGGGSTAFQVNGSNLSSSSTVNFQNSNVTNGLTLTFANPSAGNVQLGFTGTLAVAAGGTGATTLAGAALPTFSGSITSGHCVEWATSTTLEDAGAACGSGGGGSSAFSALTSGTNTTASMVVGTGANFGFSGSGIVNSNEVNGAAVPTTVLFVGTNSSGQVVAESQATNTIACNATGSSATATACSAAAATGVLVSGTANGQTGTSYTLALGDANGEVTMSNSSANTLTVPTNASVAFATNTIVTIQQTSTGTTTISPASGVTIQGAGSLSPVSLGGNLGFIQLQYAGSNVWNVIAYQPGNTTFTLSGSCTTSSPSGGATGGTFTMGSAGGCTVIVTAGGGRTASHMWVGTMYDQTQPTIPVWMQTSQSTTSATFTLPAAVANTNVMTFSISDK